MKAELRIALLGAAVLVAPWAGAEEVGLIERQEPAAQAESRSTNCTDAVAVTTTSRGALLAQAAPAPAPVPARSTAAAPATSRADRSSIVRATITGVSQDTSHIVVTEDASPTHYRFTKGTQFMDEGGRVLSPDAVKSGTNATLHFTRTEGDLVVTKVIVNAASRPLLGQHTQVLAEVPSEP